MDDLNDFFNKYNQKGLGLDDLKDEFLKKLRMKLWGNAATENCAALEIPNVSLASASMISASPQQTKKRPKRLESLRESEGELDIPGRPVRSSTRVNNDTLLTAAEALDDGGKAAVTTSSSTFTPAANGNDTTKGKISPTRSLQELMPPPPAPAAVSHSASAVLESSLGRPQRAAKLNSAKNLKEPRLNQKLRRPNHLDTSNVKVKVEHENRQSQRHQPPLADKSQDETIEKETSLLKKNSSASTKFDQSVEILPEKERTVVEIPSDVEEGDVKPAVPSEHNTENRQSTESTGSTGEGRRMVVRVKREKFSNGSTNSTVSSKSQEPKQKEAEETVASTPTAAANTELPADETTTASSTISSGTNQKPKGKKKHAVPRPIKVERFSDVNSPIAGRTRKRSQNQQQETGKNKSTNSVYEDAEDHLEAQAKPPNETAQAGVAMVNETVTILGAPNATMTLGPAMDATFQVEPNPNATVTLSKNSGGGGVGPGPDCTFNVPAKDDNDNEPGHSDSVASSKLSMATARETQDEEVEGGNQDDTLITEDESFEKPAAVMKPPLPAPPKPSSKLVASSKPTHPASAKAYRMPTRTNELFNPLIQSPVKLKVKAFENVAAHMHDGLSKTDRPKRTAKENQSSNTPLIGKLGGPVLGRFLTPTQTSNVAHNVQAKKAPNSASRIIPFPRSVTASSLKSSSSTGNIASASGSQSARAPLHRENSADDARKGFQLSAEERKKQREAKHILAAQQREAKEREKTERLAKLAKEREEKRLQKAKEAEMKKREMEEIHRKLREKEEAELAAKQKAAKAKADQEKEMLKQMKQKQVQAAASGSKGMVGVPMMPPPPKVQSKYTFEMLHEDDSTDEEGKVTYKRPPPPLWSRKHARGPALLRQENWPTDIIDAFFSVQPMTPDLKVIFPNIDERQLRRNSSVFWSTPPRYSELPKY